MLEWLRVLETLQDVGIPEPQLLAAAGSVDMTPAEPVGLAGFTPRTGFFSDVHDPLEANILVFRQGNSTVALVSCDLLYVGDALREGVRARVGPVLATEDLFMAASHTHFAPMTQRGMPRLGVVDDVYLGKCVESVSACILGLLGRVSPARLSLRCEPGPPGWSINRRLKRLRVWTRGISWNAGPGPNPNGPIDPIIRTIRVDDDGGKPIAILWNYACHPTAFPSTTSVSAEFPGQVRASLRREMQPNLPVLFFQGFAGDIRPPFRQRLKAPMDLVRRIFLGPGFGTPGTSQYQAWVDSMAVAVRRTAQTGGAAHLSPALACGRASMDLAELAHRLAQPKAVTAHCIQLAREAVLVGLNVEPLVGLRAILEKCVAPEALIPIGYIDQVHTYLPTDRDLHEGGYEVSGFRDAFAMPGQLRPGINEAIERLIWRALPPTGARLVRDSQNKGSGEE